MGEAESGHCGDILMTFWGAPQPQDVAPQRNREKGAQSGSRIIPGRDLGIGTEVISYLVGTVG